MLLANGNLLGPVGAQSGGLLNLRKFTLQGLRDRWHYKGFAYVAPVDGGCKINPDYTVSRFIEPVIAQLILNVQDNDKTGGHPDSQPCHIDQGEYFVFREVSPHDLKISLQHTVLFYQKMNHPKKSGSRQSHTTFFFRLGEWVSTLGYSGT
jgi:hypothetical protein